MVLYYGVADRCVSFRGYTGEARVTTTRLSVSVDPDLLDEAVRASGADSKREAIEAGLRELVRRHRLEAMIARRGKVPLTISVPELLREREAE